MESNSLLLDPEWQFHETLSLRCTAAGRLLLERPWGIRFPAQYLAVYILLQGRGPFILENSSLCEEVGQGDIIIVGGEEAHCLKDHRDSSTTPFHESLVSKQSESLSPERHDEVFFGLFTSKRAWEHTSSRRDFPPLVIQSIEKAPLEVIQLVDTLAILGREYGKGAILGQLFEVLSGALLFRSLGSQDSTGLRSLTDPEIGRVIGMIYQSPEHPWSVEELAKRLDMSRSSFASRFHAVVGVPPITYLTNCRMRRASELLESGGSIKEISLQVGYSSASAFSNAFKRWCGMSPATYAASHPRRDPLHRAAHDGSASLNDQI